MSATASDIPHGSPPRTPRRASAVGDRFIPSSTSRDRLVLNRHPHRLTPREKLTRTLSAGPDPFTTQIPRTPVRHRAGSSPASIGRGTRSNSSPQSSTSPLSIHRLSQSGVWGIGGGSAAVGDSVAGVPNGRGRLLASGTNASLFSSNFLSRRNSNSELDNHERRLAIALELDTASRIFTYAQPSSPADSGYGSASPTRTPGQSATAPRSWRDGQWDKHRMITSCAE